MLRKREVNAAMFAVGSHIVAEMKADPSIGQMEACRRARAKFLKDPAVQPVLNSQEFAHYQTMKLAK